MAKRKGKAKFRAIRAWASIGSHGKPFMFAAGPMYNSYGPVMHIWGIKQSADLVPVTILVPIKCRKGA